MWGFELRYKFDARSGAYIGPSRQVAALPCPGRNSASIRSPAPGFYLIADKITALNNAAFAVREHRPAVTASDRARCPVFRETGRSQLGRFQRDRSRSRIGTNWAPARHGGAAAISAAVVKQTGVNATANMAATRPKVQGGDGVSTLSGGTVSSVLVVKQAVPIPISSSRSALKDVEDPLRTCRELSRKCINLSRDGIDSRKCGLATRRLRAESCVAWLTLRTHFRP